MKGYVSRGLFRVALGPAIANEAGEAVLLTDYADQGHQYQIWTLFISTTSEVPGTASVYIGMCDQPEPNELDCVSQNGNQDRADGVSSPTWMLGGERLMIAWAGQEPGSACRARLRWEDYVQTELSVDSTLSGYGR